MSNHNTSLTNKNQVKSKNSSSKELIANCKYKQELNLRIPENLDIYIESLHNKEKAIFADFLRYQVTYFKVFPAQQTVARNVGCSREYVNKCTTRFRDDGSLYKGKQRGYNESCYYRFPSYFFKDRFRAVLSKHFPLLKFIPLILLTTLQCQQTELQFTLMNIPNIDFNFINKKEWQATNFYGATNAEILVETSELFRPPGPKPVVPPEHLPDFLRDEWSLSNVTPLPLETKGELLRYLQIANDNLKMMASVANPPWRTIERIKEQIVEYEDKLKRIESDRANTKTL